MLRSCDWQAVAQLRVPAVIIKTMSYLKTVGSIYLGITHREVNCDDANLPIESGFGYRTIIYISCEKQGLISVCHNIKYSGKDGKPQVRLW